MASGQLYLGSQRHFIMFIIFMIYIYSKWWVSQDIWHINQKLLSKIAFKVFLVAVSWPQRHSTRVSGVSDSPTSGIQMFLKEFRRHKSKKMAILLGTVSRYIFEDWNPNLCLRDINQIPYIKSYIHFKSILNSWKWNS